MSAIPGQTSFEAQPVLAPITASSVVLIVGASRGIGLEFATQVAARGATVIATHRGSAPKGALAGLCKGPRVHGLELEVADSGSARDAAKTVTEKGWGRVTHLVHNAGIYGKRMELGEVDMDVMVDVFRVNAAGVVNVVQSFVDVLAKGEGDLLPVVGVLSSKVGSVDDNGSGGSYAYRASKSACNNICKSLSIDLKGRAAFVLLHPGYVRTDMTNGNGLIDVDESVSGLLGAIEATDRTVDFRWVDFKKQLIPW